MKYPDDFGELILIALDQFATLPRSTQVACCVHSLEAEVNNDGFEQFFTNSSRLFVPQTLEALAEIGASKTSAILEKAVTVAYANGFPANQNEHDEIEESDSVYAALSRLDDAFLAYEDPITDLVNQYLSRAT